MEWTIPEKSKNDNPPLFQKIVIPETETLSIAEEKYENQLRSRSVKPRDLKHITERLSKIEKKWKDRKIGEN